MILPRNLDIDWLHEATQLVVSGRYRHRREGKTVAYLHLMLGEVMLGGPHNNYMYVGENDMITGRVMRDFKSLAETVGSNVELRTYTKATCGAQQYFFFPITHLIAAPQKLATMSLDRIFMDIDDTTQKRLDADGKLSTLFSELTTRLAERRGDVV